MTASAAPLLLLRNGLHIDGSGPEPGGSIDVLIEGDTIREVSERRITAAGAMEIDLNGRAVLPGLIDCHMHANIFADDLHSLGNYPASYAAARAANLLRDMLMRGFTTARDACGADWGLKQAIADGHMTGPRLFISGRALSQTGGHGDYRHRTEQEQASCSCASALRSMTRVVDGADAVRKAVREELRQGADQIKVMASGGLSGVNDRLHAKEFSAGELRAAVEEATARGSYVMAHAYTAAAIEHALQSGVRSIEHANLIDARVAARVAAAGAFVVPTLVTYWLPASGPGAATSPEMASVFRDMLEAGVRAVGICHAAGVQLGFGTDLFGSLHHEQGREFLLRREAQPAHEIIHSATRVNARILQQEGRLGVIAPGAQADVIVVNGNPLANIALLTNPANIGLIVKAGTIYKNSID